MKQKYTATLFAVISFVLLSFQTTKTLALECDDCTGNARVGGATSPGPAWDFFALDIYEQVLIIVGVFSATLFLVAVLLFNIGAIVRATKPKESGKTGGTMLLRWGKILLAISLSTILIAGVTIYIVWKITTPDAIPL